MRRASRRARAPAVLLLWQPPRLRDLAAGGPACRCSPRRPPGARGRVGGGGRRLRRVPDALSRRRGGAAGAASRDTLATMLMARGVTAARRADAGCGRSWRGCATTSTAATATWSACARSWPRGRPRPTDCGPTSNVSSRSTSDWSDAGDEAQGPGRRRRRSRSSRFSRCGSSPWASRSRPPPTPRRRSTAVEATRFDLALLDLRMAPTDGIALMEAVHARQPGCRC